MNSEQPLGERTVKVSYKELNRCEKNCGYEFGKALLISSTIFVLYLAPNLKPYLVPWPGAVLFNPCIQQLKAR
jgi:hypothetical protein